MKYYLKRVIAFLLVASLSLFGFSNQASATALKSHAYAEQWSNTANIGLSATSVSVNDLSEPYGNPYHGREQKEIWDIFQSDPSQWIEVGYTTGWTDSSSVGDSSGVEYSGYFYAYVLCGTSDCNFHETHISPTNATGYHNYQIVRNNSGSQQNWDIYIDNNLIVEIGTTYYKALLGQIGIESTDDGFSFTNETYFNRIEHVDPVSWAWTLDTSKTMLNQDTNTYNGMRSTFTTSVGTNYVTLYHN